MKGGTKAKTPRGGAADAILNIIISQRTLKITGRLRAAATRLAGRHSSQLAEAKAVQPVNQTIKFNLAHLSTPGLPAEALRLRMQNEAERPGATGEP